MWIKDKKGNNKRCEIISDEFNIGKDKYVMINILNEPVKISDLIENIENESKKINVRNCTQLDPNKAFDRHIYHRDQFAHYLRWTHILKESKIGNTVLDFGSGSGNLAEVLYRNRFKADEYIGLEYREKTVDEANYKFEKVDWINFKQADLTCKDFTLNKTFDVITSFEVVEHIGVDNIDNYMNNIRKHCRDDSRVFMSTPCYDFKSSCANNHITNNEVNEFTYSELENIITRNDFEIVNTYGTFASMKDYKNEMNEHQQYMFKELSKYYDTNLLSVIFAPMFPKHSRNTLWELKKCQK